MTNQSMDVTSQQRRKRKFLASVYANDAQLHDSRTFCQVQTFWCDGVKNFSRTLKDQREYDLALEEMLEKLNYKTMDIASLRQMYKVLDKNAYGIVNAKEKDRAHLVDTLLSKLDIASESICSNQK